ncbi:MAG: nucleotidyltransferase domain-containing protein [Candidatus Rokuibacteriota bacterium]
MRTMELAARRQAYGRALDDAARTVVETLRRVPGVERISAFGSYARGRRDLATDLDILVVWETDQPFLDRLRTLYALVQVPVDLDLLCYTPAEFERLREERFLKQALADEVILHETKPA